MFPESFPECSPEETGIGSGIMDADSRRAHPQSHLRPRLKEAVTKRVMTRIKRKCFMNPGQTFANEARQQMALINKCRMHERGGNGVVNQPFYAKFI